MNNGIVILNYNDYKTTKEMISQIKNFKSLKNIVIVDNNSTDNNYDKLKKLESKNIKVIRTKENKGYSHGNNVGIKYLIDNCDVENIIISNPDIIVEEKVIKELTKDLKNNKDISLIAPVINELGKKKRGWKIPSITNDILTNITFFHRCFDKLILYKDDYYKEKLSQVDVVSGCFFMIRKDVIKKIDYFDENTFLYYEENILGHKLKDKHMKTCIDNEVSVIHNLSVSVDKSINKIKKYKILKESQKYYEVNYNKANIFGIILLRMFYYISLFISYLVYYINNKWRQK